MARGRVVDSESEPGSSNRCRLLGLALPTGIVVFEPFFNQGSVLGIVTIKSVSGLKELIIESES